MIWWSIHKFDHGWSKCSDIKHLVSPTQQCLKHILKMKTTTSAGLLVKSCRRNGVKASMIRLYDLTSIALIYGKVSKTGISSLILAAGQKTK